MKKTQKKKKNTTIDLSQVLELMIEWSFECGEILNSHLIRSYNEPLKLLDKGKQGLATEADLLSEAYVMKQIHAHFPDHKILSEEDAFSRELKMEGVDEDQYLWLIDPLDGTNNFFNKVPFFCVSLALNKGSQTLAGVVYNPVTCELFYAVRGGGAYLMRLVGDKEIKIRLKATKSKKVFKEALLSANLTSKRVEKDLLKSFPEVRAMRRLGSAALELSYVAAGMLDAYWEYRLQPWDMGAAGLICEEAGVKISNIKGEKYHPFGVSVLAADPALYTPLKNILNK
ncbi:inositol monophosphatase family protein [Peredibacter sp. HCB2-198]|uniref:inositol monophosphatase family protein n=1 Tax=Peredibacter sp. HCB2-198 TaxID=3383025 RepID=UPI0038B546BA